MKFVDKFVIHNSFVPYFHFYFYIECKEFVVDFELIIPPIMLNDAHMLMINISIVIWNDMFQIYRIINI